ncbi:MAG: glycosyl transferase family 2 [Acidobacteria bacterium]|nr:glycosyl transferase family 2 [Acidobacteriota bacterium]
MLRAEVKQKVLAAGAADIVVGIPSYNNARTIGHVVRAAQAGLLRYFPDRRALIVNSDGGSKDATREMVEQSQLDTQALFVSHSLQPVHRLTTPYHGLPGKGSAFRTIFRITELVQARALAVVDADLRSITPEWFDLLLRPVLEREFDYVAPYYKRHKHDGTITNSIVYPLTRALYGWRVRQPIGGEFGVSGRLARHFLTRDVWTTDVARYGIDIWMTTTAMAEKFRVCQSYLGAKIHDAKDPGADLSAMLVQVVGSVFNLMETYEGVWNSMVGSEPAALFGFPFEVGLEPVPINVPRMLAAFAQGCRDLRPIYEKVISPEPLGRLSGCAGQPSENFMLPPEVWVKVIFDFALAYHRRTIDREHLLKSLTPLYLGWVASFARQTENETAAQVEERIEKLCLVYEQMKPHLAAQWLLGPAEKR